LDSARAHRRFRLSEEWRLDEIKIVKDSNPCDTSQKMNPPQKKMRDFH
jgi:hypothetical protein